MRASEDGFGEEHPVLGGAHGDFGEVGFDPVFEAGVGGFGVAVGDDGFGLEEGAAGEEGVAELFGGAAALGGDEVVDDVLIEDGTPLGTFRSTWLFDVERAQ